jgi:hypothetical protein
MNLNASSCFKKLTALQDQTRRIMSSEATQRGFEMILNSSDRVANLLIGSRGDPYCDDCIAVSLSIDGRQQVQRITSALSDLSSFRWEFGRCSVCGRETRVIRSN